MHDLATDRSDSSPVSERRDELAQAALATLSQLGYARTSLREIANNSPYSHGVVHYYFTGKHELIETCIDLHMRRAAHRFDPILTGIDDPTDFVESIVAAFRARVVQDLAFERLYFDLRNAALTDPEVAQMAQRVTTTTRRNIERLVERYTELSARTCAWPDETLHAVWDGTLLEAITLVSAGQPERGQDHMEGGTRHIFQAAFTPA